MFLDWFISPPGRRLGKVEEECETLARDVRMLKNKCDDLENRCQKLAWRLGKVSAGELSPAFTEDLKNPEPGNTAPPAVDPVSAQLLARRGRTRAVVPKDGEE